MKFKHGDMVDVEGYTGEVIKVTEAYIEVMYSIDDERVVLSNNASHKKPNSD